MDEERRRRRREVQMLSSESTWLQKALFALQKAEAAREKLTDSRGEDMGELVLTVGSSDVSLEDLEEGIENRIRTLLDEVSKRRKRLG